MDDKLPPEGAWPRSRDPRNFQPVSRCISETMRRRASAYTLIRNHIGALSNGVIPDDLE